MRTRALEVLLLVSAIVPFAPLASQAQFQNCPSQGALKVCEISTERSTLTVETGSGAGPSVQVVSWLVDGVEQMGVEAIRVHDEESDSFPSMDLFSAETVTEDVQILIFHEFDGGTLSTAFALRDREDGPSVFIDLFLTIESGTSAGSIYLVSDLDLAGDPEDQSVELTDGGLPVTHGDGNLQSVFELIRGDDPTALDVGLASEFAPLVANQVVELDGTESAFGPADLSSALVWQAEVSAAQAFHLQMRRTLLVPEPGSVVSASASLACLGWLARKRRRIAKA